MNSKSFKVIFVGDEGVGKTSFVNFITKRDYSPIYKPTDCVEVSEYRVADKKMEIWDCGSKNAGLREGYWIGANVAVIMFAGNSLESWRNASKYVKEVIDIVGSIPIIIVGAKLDNLNAVIDRGVVARRLFALRRQHPNLRYMECSAKIGYNCDEVMGVISEYMK